MKKILFVCTSNKDRSPALEQYFRSNYPKNEYKSAGVNKYFCVTGNKTLICPELIQWADIIVFAENIHFQITWERLKEEMCNKETISLNLGEFNENIKEDYLTKAECKIKFYLT